MSKIIEQSSETVEECATRLFEAAKWDVLADICSKQQKGKTCHFEEGFSIVHLNLVRKIEFKDNVRWTAMLRLSILDPDPKHRTEHSLAIAFQNEIDSMKFIKCVTPYLSNMSVLLTCFTQHEGRDFHTRSEYL